MLGQSPLIIPLIVCTNLIKGRALNNAQSGDCSCNVGEHGTWHSCSKEMSPPIIGDHGEGDTHLQGPSISLVGTLFCDVSLYPVVYFSASSSPGQY